MAGWVGEGESSMEVAVLRPAVLREGDEFD